MLLADLLKATPREHPDHTALSTSLASVRDLAAWLNEEKRRGENQAVCLELHEAVCGLPEGFVLLQPTREYMRRGKVFDFSHTHRRCKPRTLFMFSDLLLLCKSSEAGGALAS